jgi:ATP-dependent exoDNAse (exonuclease V) beta subunit
MSNRANDEQLLAIEHSGGVLLSAGAGSGKTFVLKEHLIYLCQNWIQEFKMNPTIEFSSFIKSKLRKVVMMTFTNKAAGELEIRLKNEIREMTEDESTADSTYWNEILKNIDYLNVSTIHGFCLKLIRQGFFPHIDPDQKIVAEADFKKCITDLFEGWLSKSHSQIDSYNVEMVFKNKNKVLEAIFHIFSDATVRTTWTSLVDRKLKVEDTDEVIREIFTVTGLDLIWQEDISLDSYSEFATKKWFKFIEEFRSCWKQFDFSMESVCKLNEYFNEREYKIPVKPSGKTVPISIKNYYENIKNLKDFFKKNGESISEFSLQFEGKVSSWFETLQSIVNYIEKRYQKLDGLTFSDLEYFVALELQGDSTIERITNEYEYFIIDEFQDTSFIQFSIIRKIIQDDFSRLFCVGDPKQAIYGFRGGEIGVFLECQEKMSINLQLKNNYRSTKNIINFNNQMFDFLFKKGIGFKGEEKNPVVVYYQTVPSEDVLSGEVAELCCTLGFRDLVDKISNAEIDLIESLTLFTKLKELKSYQKKSAVLYKRLKPSLILVGLLIKENIGFTAQVKIPFLEDPINGIFFEIIKHVKDSSDKKREYLLYILNAYLSIISGRKSYQITDMDLRNFDRDVKYFGLYMGFSNLMNACRLYNSNYIQNLDFIKQSILSTRSNIDELLILMNSQKSLSYSLDFQYGEDPGDIILMSAHASKGLQFPNVLLGGIYTNDSLIPNKSPVGKLPLSFKWASQLTGNWRN